MIEWDHEAKKQKLSARLGKLPPPALITFAAAVMERALGVVLGKKKAKTRALVLEAIESAWRAVEGGDAAVRDLADRISEALPDEDDSPPPGHADLLDGASSLVALVRKPQAKSASSIASYAYQAVLDRFIDDDDASGGEDDFLRAERATPEATRERAAQYAILAAVEAAGPRPVRKTVLAAAS